MRRDSAFGDAAPVRLGEDLDWPTVDCATCGRELPELRRRARGPAVPQRLGQPHLPAAVRRPAAGAAPAAVRADRARRPRHGPGVPGAVPALARLPAAPRGRCCSARTRASSARSSSSWSTASGVVIWDAIPESMRSHPDVGRRVGLRRRATPSPTCTRSTTRSCGLADLGRPDGFVARQVARLAQPLGRGRRGRRRTPVMREVADAARAAPCPRPQRAAILHNDLKLDNCQFDPADPDRVHSVFDWDMATLGDPLVDLGTLLNYWPDPADRPGDRGIYPDGQETLGLPTQAEIVAALRRRDRPRPVAGIGWYQAFACWKTAVVLQQLHDRYLRGETADERMATRGDRVAELAARARRLLGGSGGDGAQPPTQRRRAATGELGLRDRAGIPGAARLDRRVRARRGRADRPAHRPRLRHDRPGPAAADPAAAGAGPRARAVGLPPRARTWAARATARSSSP